MDAQWRRAVRWESLSSVLIQEQSSRVVQGTEAFRADFKCMGEGHRVGPNQLQGPHVVVGESRRPKKVRVILITGPRWSERGSGQSGKKW